MNGGIDPDPCDYCWCCDRIAFCRKEDAMGGLWLKNGVCNECRAKGLLGYKERQQRLGPDLDMAIEKLFQALIKPKGLRLKLLKWLYPEIVNVANTLRDYYWNS